MTALRICVERFTEAADRLADATLCAGASLAVFSREVARHPDAFYFNREEERDYYYEQDLETERDLGPWPSRDGWTEEVAVEMVPIDWAEPQ